VKQTGRPLLLLLAALFIILMISALVGSVSIPLPVFWKLLGAAITGQSVPEGFETYHTILFQLRLARVVLVALTGAALAGSGAAYQGLFRNPLADPYLLGIASGAGLGAVAAMGLRSTLHISNLFLIPAAAALGAITTVLLVVFLARSGRSLPTTHLILAGVAVSSFTTALTSFLMLNASGDLRRALVWLLGGSTLGGWQPVIAMLPYVTLGLVGLLLLGHPLNVLQVGDEQARQLGLPVSLIRWLVIAAASITAASAVAFSGVIGFVGLITPHIIRLWCGADYRRLLPLSMLGGAILLLAADLVARTIIAPQELPVGVITALAGAPFFLWVLRRSRSREITG
jgi:iron complex transport system permease protein